MDEGAIIALLKKNNPACMKMIFDHAHASLCKLAYTVVKDSDLAKDVVQEVLIKLWRNRQNLVLTGSLNSYLRKAVVNTAINQLNSSRLFRKESLDRFSETLPAAQTIEHELDFTALSQKAQQAIRALPQRTQAVFTLIRYEEMSYKEVAETLSISTKAVEKEMMKALKLLREALRNYLYIGLIMLLKDYV